MEKRFVLAIFPLLAACSSGDSVGLGGSPATSRPVDMQVSGTDITPITFMGMDAFDINDGTVIEQLVIPNPGNVDGETIFQRVTSGATAVAFSGNDVIIAAAGDPFGAAFAVIDGTTEALPTGDVIYEGHYTVAAADQIESHGDLSLQFGFSDNSLTGTSDDTLLTVMGVVDNNGVISGSVDFDGTDMGLNGGIYGSNADELAAGFTDTFVGGYIYGERQ